MIIRAHLPTLGLTLLVSTSGFGATHYVDLNSSSPTPPYTNWDAAATVIQDAVDASMAGDEIVVTNGIYSIGGRVVYGTMTNRVAVDKPLTLRSVNGPQFTVIQGYQVRGATNGDGAIRCVYLTYGASLSGFTLTNGATLDAGDFLLEQCGGGLMCESTNALVFKCVVAGNSAAGNGGGAAWGTLNNCTLSNNSAGAGGGAAWASLNNCTLTGNSASQYGGGGAAFATLNNCRLTQNVEANSAGDDGGGGAELCTLNNCTLSGNSARLAGGANYCTLNNSIIYFNTATVDGANCDDSCTLNRCCTTPEHGFGVGNITNAPLFVDYSGGNLRLQTNSPCINAGNNAYAPPGTDLDSNPRIAGGTVDIGAYEFQTPASLISYAWLQQYGLPTDGSMDYADPDSDGMNNWQEWRAGTSPTNPADVLKMVIPAGVTNTQGITMTWQSVSGISYCIERSTNLGNLPAFSILQSNIVGQPGATTYTDTNAVGSGPFFYRVGVRN